MLAKGYAAIFCQHSGVPHSGSPFDFLPRFPMTGRHSAARRFRLAADALPLAVSDITPADPYLVAGRNPPDAGFTVTIVTGVPDGLPPLPHAIITA